MKSEKTSKIESATLEDYAEAANTLTPLQHPYAVVVCLSEDTYQICDIMNNCQWEHIITDDKIVIVNTGSKRKFRIELMKFLREELRKNGIYFYVRFVG